MHLAQEASSLGQHCCSFCQPMFRSFQYSFFKVFLLFLITITRHKPLQPLSKSISLTFTHRRLMGDEVNCVQALFESIEVARAFLFCFSLKSRTMAFASALVLLVMPLLYSAAINTTFLADWSSILVCKLTQLTVICWATSACVCVLIQLPSFGSWLTQMIETFPPPCVPLGAPRVSFDYSHSSFIHSILYCSLCACTCEDDGVPL